MVETIYCKNLTELKREKKFLERKLHVAIATRGRVVTLTGDPLDEYEARRIIEALNLGFSARTASLITHEDFIFETIHIKDHTRRKNLDIVRGRIIGTHGGTKRTIEQIAGCTIKIKDNIIGIIGPAEEMQYAITAVTNVLKGTKQTNAYKYLERINTKRKKERKADK